MTRMEQGRPQNNYRGRRDCVAIHNFQENTFVLRQAECRPFRLSSLAVAVVPYIQSIPRFLSRAWVTDAPRATHTHTPRDL